jgi:SAM-dependent methyltransferase
MDPTVCEIKAKAKDRFARIAGAPGSEKKFPAGPTSAKKLGYDPREIDSLPMSVTESFSGVGNPLGRCGLRTGEKVLKLDGGSGMDSLLAPRRNAELVGFENFKFINAGIEESPLPDEPVVVVISNGVLNLCPDTPRVVTEAFRVLRPDGRIQMANILLEEGVTPEEVAHEGSWSD